MMAFDKHNRAIYQHWGDLNCCPLAGVIACLTPPTHRIIRKLRAGLEASTDSDFNGFCAGQLKNYDNAAKILSLIETT